MVLAIAATVQSTAACQAPGHLTFGGGVSRRGKRWLLCGYGPRKKHVAAYPGKRPEEEINREPDGDASDQADDDDLFAAHRSMPVEILPVVGVRAAKA